MTVTKRIIHASGTYGRQYVEARTREDGDAELRDTSMKELTGVLKQLGLLAHYATEMFTELYDMAQETSSGIESVAAKITHLEQTTDTNRQQATGKQASAAASPVAQVSQLSDKKRRLMINQLYEECEAPPALHLLDETQGGSCLKNYTNPDLFFAEWSKEEEARQAKEQERLLAAREEAERKRKMSRAAAAPRHKDASRRDKKNPQKLLLSRKDSSSRVASINAHKAVENKWKRKSNETTDFAHHSQVKPDIIYEEKGEQPIKKRYEEALNPKHDALKPGTSQKSKPSTAADVSGGDRGNLMAAIRNGKALKSVSSQQQMTPSLTNAKAAKPQLATSLQKTNSTQKPNIERPKAAGPGELLASIRQGTVLKKVNVDDSTAVPNQDSPLLAAIRQGKTLKRVGDSGRSANATPPVPANIRHGNEMQAVASKSPPVRPAAHLAAIRQGKELNKVASRDASSGTTASSASIRDGRITQPKAMTTSHLAAIRQGKTLKKVTESDTSAPRPKSNPGNRAPNFLADIKAGVKLNKANAASPKAPPAPPKSNQMHSSLLDQIKSGRQVLKKSPVKEERAKKKPAPAATCTTVAEILARRVAILGCASDISDSGSESSWDEDEAEEPST